MGIKLIKKNNEDRADRFDFSDANEDAKQFDFVNLLSRLDLFRSWVEGLAARIEFKMPKLHYAANGSSGYCYRISNDDRTSPVQFRIQCGTNPERYPKFEGYITARSRKPEMEAKSWDINAIEDLTDALEDSIVATVKGRA